jgi:type I restriction-modification system DNA methylase subunit
VDFNATTHGQRDLDDDRLSNLIEEISAKRLGLTDVEPDIIGRSYEYLIRKFAENSGKSAGEFYTPAEVGLVIARIMDAEPGMDIYDPCSGSAGLLIKCELVLQQKMNLRSRKTFAPARLYGQENEPGTWAMANMNMIIHDMEGEIQIGDTFRKPKFRKGDPKNYIPDDAIVSIADTFTAWKEKDKYSRIVTREEIAKNDFNISPSRYIHTGEADEYRPIAEIVEELNVLEEEAKTTDAALKEILKRIGV